MIKLLLHKALGHPFKINVYRLSYIIFSYFFISFFIYLKPKSNKIKNEIILYWLAGSICSLCCFLTLFFLFFCNTRKIKPQNKNTKINTQQETLRSLSVQQQEKNHNQSLFVLLVTLGFLYYFYYYYFISFAVFCTTHCLSLYQIINFVLNPFFIFIY